MAVLQPTQARPDGEALKQGPELEAPADAAWVLHGVRSNERYVEREERARLARVQEGLDRPGCTRAALIPILVTTERGLN